jgi:hypothetical protein
VLQCEPLTVATTVTFALVARWVLTADDSEGPVRTFTPAQAGIIVDALAAAVSLTATCSPPSAPRSATRSQTSALVWTRPRVRGCSFGEAMRRTMAGAMRACNGSMGP